MRKAQCAQKTGQIIIGLQERARERERERGGGRHNYVTKPQAGLALVQKSHRKWQIIVISQLMVPLLYIFCSLYPLQILISTVTGLDSSTKYK